METNAKIIKVYSTPVCPWCDVAKNFLKDNGIEFEVIDVSQNQELAMDLINKTGQTGVPVIEIDGEYIIGFDKQKLIAILGL